MVPVLLHLASCTCQLPEGKGINAFCFPKMPPILNTVWTQVIAGVNRGYKRQMEKCQCGSVELPERYKTMDELQFRLYLVSDRQMKGCNINIHPLTWIF